jgi:SAM-dependent methyltransferase
MPEYIPPFDAHFARAAWDRAADTYAAAQDAGRDFYRLEFFGPLQVAACGDVSGRKLLDVGCGSGYFAREMARGGARVTGIDISGRMVELARGHEVDEPLGIEYVLGDAGALGATFEPGSFDVVTSCMAIQDMPDIPGVLRGIREVLRPGGRFIPSITHPCSDTPFRQWECDEEGGKRWLCIDRYFERGKLEYRWTGWGHDFTTPAVHATLEDWFGWILGAGFELRALLEPRPTDAAVRARPKLGDAARIPYYLILNLAVPV